MSGFKRDEVVALPGFESTDRKTWLRLNTIMADENLMRRLHMGLPVGNLKDRTQDLYFVEAAKHFGIPIEEVTPEQRRQMKDILFGQLYGQSEEVKALRAEAKFMNFAEGLPYGMPDKLVEQPSDKYRLARQQAMANVWRIVYGLPDEPTED